MNLLEQAPILRRILRQKITTGFIFSSLLFLVCVSLDFYMTNTVSGGDFTREGNFIGRLWWQLTGSFRFIEIPVWIVAVIGAAYVINFKSNYLALVWLNFVAFNHFVGFLTWLPYGTVDFLYILVKEDWVRAYFTSAITLPCSVLFSFLQTKPGVVISAFR